MSESTGPQIIADRLKPILTEPEESGYLLLVSEYKNFLSNVNDHPCFDEFKSSSKFLALLTQVCISVQLTYEERVYCNAMIFDRINTANDVNKVMLLNLGLVANRTMTSAFIKCGLDKTMATFLAVSRKSSFKPQECISRLNFTIMCTSPSLMTTKRITDIYCTSCNTEEDVYRLFTVTNKDILTQEDWVTQDHWTIYGRMNSAILSILESMNVEQLADILEAYYIYEVSKYELDREDVRIRFNDLDPMMFPNIYGAMCILNQKHHHIP